MTEPLQLSVVVALRDSAGTLDQALMAIHASGLSPDTYEVIVVDDSSEDRSPVVAARYADTVVRLTGRASGPAYARNRGAELARGEIVAFIDADVRVHPQTLRGMLQTLRDSPGLDAISASHDDRPAADHFVSQYWNLLLHYCDQHKGVDGGQFSAACGAVRRTALLSAGMYDEWRFGARGLEDIELGQRLRAAGHHLLLSRELQFTQLGRWSLAAVYREVWSRSVLLARSLGYQRTLTMVPSEVVFTLSRSTIPLLALTTTIGLSAAFTPRPHRYAHALLFVAALLLTNPAVHRFFVEARGIGFAIAVAPLHIVAQAVSGVALCTGWILRDVVGDRLPDATTQAYSEVGLETWPPVPQPR